jgi:ubiquinone/menaquinone biosynthesis C-methylase UbiE
LAKPVAGESLIEVGCGTAPLLRRIVRQYAPEPVVGLDVNRFLLREAPGFARREGIGHRLTLCEGSAEEISFPSDSFDIVFTSTVMEEADADRMIPELVGPFS